MAGKQHHKSFGLAKRKQKEVNAVLSRADDSTPMMAAFKRARDRKGGGRDGTD